MNGSKKHHPLGHLGAALALSWLPRIAAAAVATIGLSFGVPLDAVASSTTAPSGPDDTSAPASSDRASDQSSPDYSPPKVQPYALIGAGALVLIAIVWTLRSGGNKDSSGDAGADPNEVPIPSSPPSGPPPAPGSAPPADLSDD